MKTEDLNTVSGFNVTVSDIILTPLACASLVNEILKGLLYQKCQIPYPYSWMKARITNKRQKTDSEETNRISFQAANHYLLVSNVFDKFEAVMQGITDEFRQHKTNIREILFVLGPTPHTAREVITISISSLVKGHNERNHVEQLNKYQQRILRSIFLSQEWLDKVDASHSCTNIYIYIVRNSAHSMAPNDNTNFIPTNPMTFPAKTKQIQISLHSGTLQDTNCCENLTVFEDASENLNVPKTFQIEETEDHITWYKFKELIKGFKDCYVNKKSVSESW